MFRHAITLLVLALIPSSISELIFNFTDFPPKVPEIDFFDDAQVLDNSTLAPDKGIIEITTNQTSPKNNTFNQGRAVYNNPIPLHSSDGSVWDFTTHFKFVIDGSGNTNTGDGLAFFLVPVNWSPPMNSTGCWLGLFNRSTNGQPTNQVVAVEFDTFQNAEDPSPQHMGIDVKGVYSNFTDGWQWDSTKKLNGEASVAYNHAEKTLSATLVYQNGFRQSNISQPIDLTTVLPENITVGFSAATGHYTERHFILSWDFASTLSTGSRTGKTKSISKRIIGLVAACSTALLVLLVVIVTILAIKRWKKIKKGEKEMEAEEEEEQVVVGVAEDEGAELMNLATGPRRFSYSELALATKNFDEKWKLGQGGFGGVYFGVLPDTSNEVAVKRFWRGSSQGKKEFLAEVTVISRLRHRNLVPLTGWCHDRGELMLVYDYMSGGSLDMHLFKPKAGEVMPWDQRMKVALGLASAVLYLHEEWEQCVVHRDIKSSNVMIDSKFNARLGDFGLARLVNHSRAAQTTMVAGTMGYLAPECVSTGKATKDSDMYSFGAVLLEIASGRSATQTVGKEEETLVEWVWSLFGVGKLMEAVDERLGSEFVEMEAECLMTVGLWCVHPDQKRRPSMKEAILVLNFQAELPRLPRRMPVPVFWAPPVVRLDDQQRIGEEASFTSGGSDGNEKPETRV